MLSSKDVIHCLNQSGGSTTVEALSTHLQVTPRTIQNHLKKLQGDFPDCFTVQKGRIRLIKPLPESTSADIPSSQQERARHILRELLSRSEPLDLDELAASLYISEITLQNEIKALRRSIASSHLSLRTKNNKVFLSGSEKDKKQLMIHMIYHEAQHSLVSLDTLRSFFPKYDISFLRESILSCLNEQHFFIDEYSLTNLLLHILISMEQLESYPNPPRRDLPTESVEVNRHFASIIDKVCAQLEQRYGIAFTRSNKYQFTLLLMTRAVRSHEDDLPHRSELSIRPQTMKLVDIIVQAVQQMYNIELADIEFFIPFSLHIDNMLIRLREKVAVHNPILHSIKTTSPIIYDIAVYISDLINHYEHVQLYEDEIAYIALHIGARIQDVYNRRRKLSAVLLCPQYYAYEHKQFERLQSYFSDDLTIEIVVTSPSELERVKCDLVLSTLSVQTQQPFVLISNFVNEHDRKAISEAVHQIKHQREKDCLLVLLKSLIDRELFQPDSDYPDRESAILSIGARMVARGIIDEDFIERTLERENISSTSFGMIAIPHPSDCSAARSAIAVTLLRNPLRWGSGSVRIIFMISVSKSDLSDFSDIFSYLPRICSDYGNLERLAAATCYEDFIQTIGTVCSET